MPTSASRLCLAVAFAAFCLTPVKADSVRLGQDFSDIVGFDMSDFGTVAKALARADLAARAWTKGSANCRPLVSMSAEEEEVLVKQGTPWFSLRSARVECWAILQLDPKAEVATTRQGDGITQRLILEILENVLPPSEEKGLWIALANKEPFNPHRRSQDDATLISREGLWLHGDWKELHGSIEFQILAAFGDDRILSVHGWVKGRPETLFGVRWRKTDTGGEVVEVFPDIDPP